MPVSTDCVFIVNFKAPQSLCYWFSHIATTMVSHLGAYIIACGAFIFHIIVLCLGGVGFDINCGVRLIRTNLDFKDIQPVKEQLAQVWIYLFIHLFLHYFFHSFIHLFIHPFFIFFHSLIHSFIHTYIHSFIN